MSDVETATGLALDRIGEEWEVHRIIESDAAFRQRIVAKIARRFRACTCGAKPFQNHLWACPMSKYDGEGAYERHPVT